MTASGESSAAPPPSVGVWGAGLIGTSVALAVQAAGGEVRLYDRDHRASRQALAVAGTPPWDPRDSPGWCPEVVLSCVPPAATAGVLAEASRLYVNSTISDVSSVKYGPLVEAEALGADMSRVVGGHPMAGRERSGSLAARQDLFQGRAWALVPTAQTTVEAVDRVRRLVVAVGAYPVVLGPAEHDAAIARLSHLPQLVASALALVGGQLPAAHAELAGPGFADMTRLAASPARLWQEILSLNAAAVGAAVDALEQVLVGLRDGAGDLDSDRMTDLLVRGAGAKAALPVKRRPGAPAWGWVQVVLADKPGELLAVLAAAGAGGINIEDIRLDHAPHQATGVVELAVSPVLVEQLIAALAEVGYLADALGRSAPTGDTQV